MRTSPTLTLVLLLAAGGCATTTTVDPDVRGETQSPVAVEDGAEGSAMAACEEYAAYVEANKAKESGTAEILDRALTLSADAAAQDDTHASLAAGIASRLQAGEDLKAAVEGGTSDGEAVDAAIELITSSNEAVATACSPLGVDVDYAT